MSKCGPIRLRFAGAPGAHTEADCHAINTLQRDIFGEILQPVRYCYWWLAYASDKPVGFCALYHYPDCPSTAFLALCGVRKSARGMGLQRRMVQVRVKKCRQLGVTRLISYTSHDNAQSANNLFRSGFRVYTPRWEWGVRHAIYFQRMLDG